MTQRTVTAVYRADVDRFISDTVKAKAAVTGFGKEVAGSSKSSQKAWGDFGTKAALVGAGLGAVFVGAVKTFADFDKSMSGVSAALDDGTRSAGQLADEKKRLAAAALEAGEASVFSASEAAQAEGELARAGLKTADIIGGALKGSLDLAAAGQVDLANSAELTAQTLTIFDLAGDQASRVADTLTAGANKSAAGVDDLGMALKQGGGVAAQWGLTLEETVGTLSLFADNALKGSDAGTSMRTMLGRLNPTTKEAAAMMEQLGLNFYDAEGNFIGISAAAQQLHDAIAPLPQNLRDTAVQTIFGQDAQRSANILIDEGAAGLQEYIKGVTDKGAAERMAARQTDNLVGDLEQLKGAFESAFIRGGSGANDGLRDLVQLATDAVRWFNALPPEVQANTVKLIGLSAAALLVAAGGIKATTSILALKASMDAAGISGTRLATTLKAVGKGGAVAAIAGISVALGEMQGEARVADVDVQKLADSIDSLVDGGRLSGGIADLFRDNDPGFLRSREEIVTMTEAVERFQNIAKAGLPEGFMADVKRGFTGGYTAAAQFDKTITQLDAGLAKLVQGGGADEAAAAVERLTKGMTAQDKAAVVARLTGYSAALDEAAVSATTAGRAVGELPENLEAADRATTDSTEAAEEYAQALEDVQSAIIALGGGLRAEQQAIADSGEALREAQKVAKDGKASRADDEAALRSLSEQYLKVSAAQVEMGRGAGEVGATMKQNRADFIATAVSMGMLPAYANELADAYGLIPTDVQTMVSAVGAETSAEQVTDLKTVIKGLDGKTVTVKEAGQAKPSKDNVLELDGAIFGLKSKTVKVQELGATASGDRVVKLNGKIYTLKGKTVQVGVTGTERAVAKANELIRTIDRITGKTVYVNVVNRQLGQSGASLRGGQVKGAATGGYIRGPGTTTSDDIPMLLSDKEYVTKAAAVAYWGVDFMHELNQMQLSAASLRRLGVGGLATGGQVLASRPAAYAARPAPVSMSPVVQVTAPQGASVATVDPGSIRAMAREVATETARETANAILAAQRGTALTSILDRKVGGR